MNEKKKNRKLHLRKYSKNIWLNLAILASGFSVGYVIASYTMKAFKYEEEFLEARVETVLNEVKLNTRQDTIDFEAYHSLINGAFEKYKIKIDFQYGISTDSIHWAFLSHASDSSILSQSTYIKSIETDEILHIRLLNSRGYVLGQLRSTYIVAGIMFLILLVSMITMSENIKRQYYLGEQKNNFINNITHELKTPIATIDFALANIENEKNITRPDKIREITNVIREENKRMNMQVERVLRVAKADKKALQLDTEEVDIHEIIEVLSDGTQLKIQQLGGNLQENLQAKKAIVTGDAFHLTNVFSNLLDNAIKYSKDQPNVTISTSNNQKGISVKVQDQGIGIDLKHQRNVFERFFRVDTGDLHNVKGFGLGLSYVKSIVEQHGGKVSLKSKLGKGSTFIVFLPFENKK